MRWRDEWAVSIVIDCDTVSKGQGIDHCLKYLLMEAARVVVIFS